MELLAQSHPRLKLLAVKGRIDQTSAEDFRMALEPHLDQCAEGQRPLVLDFSEVPYISSIGLRVLMLAARQAAAQQGQLAITSLTPVVREVFSISRFDLVLKTCDSVDAAAMAFS